MGAAVVIFLALLCVSSALVGMVYAMTCRLTPEANFRQLQKWLVAWSMKGLGAPAILWAIMNLGVCWQLQPFMPQVQAARNGGGPWFPDFLKVLGCGFFIVSSYWTAITLGWILIRTAKSAEP